METVRIVSMKKKRLLWIGVPCLVLGILILIMGISKMNRKEKGIFSWYPDVVRNEEMIETAIENEITEIYQMFSNQTSDDEVCSFLKAASQKEIAVYGLLGEAEWAVDATAEVLLGEVNRIKGYNSLVSEEDRIQGIVLDIEPYTLAEWGEKADEILESYTQVLKLCYQKMDGLKLFICIPYYYDSMGYENYLEIWAKQCCDGFMVMNYNVGNEIENIRYEIGLCEKYDRRIVSIYELNEPGGQVETNTSYYDSTLKEVEGNFRGLKREYRYKKLAMAYHEYQAFKEMPFE